MLAENPKLNHFTYYKPDYAPPPIKPRNSCQVRATVDGRNLAPIDKYIVVYSISHRVLYIPGGARFLPSTNHQHT